MRYDLHVHSKYSRDGYMDPKLIVKKARQCGLSGVAVTDHNTIKGGLITKKYETDDLKVIVGSEVNTNRGEVMGLFLNEEIKSFQFPEVVEEIRDQDGIVITPHPFDEIRANGINPTKEDTSFIDCVEIFNSRCLLDKYNFKAKEFAARNKLKFSAGSDAHFAREIGKAGIRVNTESKNINDLKKILLRGDSASFGEKSNFVNLILTKVIKTWRKTGSG